MTIEYGASAVLASPTTEAPAERPLTGLTDRYEVGVQKNQNAAARDAEALDMLRIAHGKDPVRRPTAESQVQKIAREMRAPQDGTYAEQHHSAMAANVIANEDAKLDRTISDFLRTPGVDHFDEQGVLREWHDLIRAEGRMTPDQLQRAYQSWHSKTLTIQAALEAVAGKNSSAAKQIGSLKDSGPSVAERTYAAAVKELRRREAQYTVRRGAR